MALIQLWESPAATTFELLNPPDTVANYFSNSPKGLSPIPNAGFAYWAARGGLLKVYLDGSYTRLGTSYPPVSDSWIAYDWNKGYPLLYIDSTNKGTIDPVSWQWKPGEAYNSEWVDTFAQGITPGTTNASYLWTVCPVLYKTHIYYVRYTDGRVFSRHAVTGVAGTEYALPAPSGYGVAGFFNAQYISFSKGGDRLIAVDWDNNASTGASPAKCVVRVWSLEEARILYESTIPPVYIGYYDQELDILWTIRKSDAKAQVHMMQPAPSTFDGFSVGVNRSRYKSDLCSATLKGTNGEPVPDWPCKWTLSGSQGVLETDYDVTNSSGVTANRYIGPGLLDFTGGSQTIEVETAY